MNRLMVLSEKIVELSKVNFTSFQRPDAMVTEKPGISFLLHASARPTCVRMLKMGLTVVDESIFYLA